MVLHEEQEREEIIEERMGSNRKGIRHRIDVKDIAASQDCFPRVIFFYRALFAKEQ